MKSKLLAVIAASGLALASTLVEARGPGGGQSMGGGYGNAPAQTQQGNVSPARTQEQDRTRTQEQDRTRTQEQDRTRTQEQDRTRTQEQDRTRTQEQDRTRTQEQDRVQGR
jgi:membrane protein involved in colicin uptake